jgi:hypothetical protein
MTGTGKIFPNIFGKLFLTVFRKPFLNVLGILFIDAIFLVDLSTHPYLSAGKFVMKHHYNVHTFPVAKGISSYAPLAASSSVHMFAGRDV